MSAKCFLAVAMSVFAFVSHALAETNSSASSEQGEVRTDTDVGSGIDVVSLRHGDTTVRVAPSAGCNVFSINVGGTEFLRVPADLARLKGVSFGTPILYPMPNRVRGAQFNYAGQTFKFPPNGRGNFIHGLVHSVAWTPVGSTASKNATELTCVLSFEKAKKGEPDKAQANQRESELHQAFPLAHRIEMNIRVTDGAVRWTYSVVNTGDRSIPFGLALHPYFSYLGKREQAYLQVRAESLMAAERQLPSGKLLDLDGHSLDARQPVSLFGFKADDVFYGVQNSPAAVVDFRDRGRKIIFRTSDEFKHCVVYTPARPFFCVESQTCSTDAHNLAANGMSEVARLQECAPGKTMSGWVKYRFE